MKRNDPCAVRTRNEHDDSKGDARVTIRRFLHAKCSAQKSQHKYRGREDKKISGKPGRQERSSESTQRGSGKCVRPKLEVSHRALIALRQRWRLQPNRLRVIRTDARLRAN